MAELIPISITIADRTFRIKVGPKDEEPVRKTVKFINDKIMEFKTNLSGKDMQDYVSMVLVWYATQPAYSIAGSQLEEDMLEGLARLEAIADKGLATPTAEEAAAV